MTLNITEPTVGGSSGSWGTQLNDALTAIVAYVNALESNAQPVDADLTAIAALTTTAYGRSLLTQANAAAAQTVLGLGSAATQATSAFDAAGAAAAAQAASQPLDSDLTAIAALTTTAFGRSFLDRADATAARTLLGLGTLATQSGTFSGTSSGTNTGDQDLSALAPKASPALTGTPTAPTQTAGDNSTKVATTAYADASAGTRLLKGRAVAKTTAYTAALGDVVLADTTGGTFTVTLPAASGGTGRIVVKWTAGATAPTIVLTGTDHVNTSAGVTSFAPTYVNQGYQLESDGAALWIVTADDISLTGLDARYVQSANAAPLAQAGQVPSQAPVAAGTADVGSLTSTARADHVHPSAGLFALWGSGADGDFVFDGTTALPAKNGIPGSAVFGTFSAITPSANTYTLLRPMFFRNVTINAGVTVIVPAGCTIYMSGTFTNNGTLAAAGGTNASGATGAAAPAVLTGATFGLGGAGSNGTTTTGTAITSALDGYYVTGMGGTGGTGASGAGASGNRSSLWGAVPGAAAQMGAMFTLFTGLVGTLAPARPLAGGQGGGGGGGDGTNAGGGGGGGGSVLILNAKTVVNTGTIKANGGNGAAGTGGNAGGGGGGSAGGVIINTLSYTNTGSVTATAGTGGAGAGTGTSGGTGYTGPVIVTVWA